MSTNTGTVSFILYGIFVIISIVGLVVAIYFIVKKTITLEQMDKIIDLSKYTVVSIALTTITLIITDLFKEREQDVKELEYFDKYVQDVKKVDGIQERFQLVKYLSIVAPNGDLKQSWKEYYDTVNVEFKHHLSLIAERERLNLIKNPTEKDLLKKEKITEKIEQNELPLVASYNNLIPRVYIHIISEEQRKAATALQATLINENFQIPGIENVGKKGNIYIPAKTEVRYYRIQEFADAQKIIAIIKSQNLAISLNETPQKIPGNGRGTRPGHFEIWFSKNN